MTEVRTTSSTGGQKGVKLARYSLIPAGPLHALAEHYGVGGLKYASHQWRNGYEFSKSYDALQRHATAWLSGQSYDTCSAANFEGCSDVDSDGNPFKSPREDACYNHTGSHHMAAVAWHAFAIQEFEERFPEHDDRYVPDSNTLEGKEAPLQRADIAKAVREMGLEGITLCVESGALINHATEGPASPPFHAQDESRYFLDRNVGQSLDPRAVARQINSNLAHGIDH